MRVAYSSPFVPPEWIAAHGARPERIVPDPAPVSPGPPHAGVCPYARAFMSEVVTRGRCDAVVVTTTCDQMRRAAEWIGRNGSVPVFLMNVPATWRGRSHAGGDPPAALYLEELRRLGRFLVGLGGPGVTPPSDDALREIMARHDARRAELEELGPREALSAAGVIEPREEPARAGAKAGPSGDPPPVAPVAPVALIGGPLMRGDGRLFDVIERAGGRVVLDGTEGGVRTFPAAFDRRQLRRRPLAELVRAYFAGIPDAFRRPDRMLYEWIREELAASGAGGVIVRRYAWCDMWAAAPARLKEETSLPVLELHSSGGTAAAAALESEARRIEAFMEVLG